MKAAETLDARDRVVVQVVQQAPDDLIDRPDVIEVQAWKRLLNSGALQSVRIGRKRLVRRSHYLALVDSSPAVPTSTHAERLTGRAALIAKLGATRGRT